eukprot:2461266-Karenia_brevis.AAC.1
MNPTSALLQSFAKHNGLWAPSSFHQHVKHDVRSPDGTYYHSMSSDPVRIDYVLISDNVTCSHNSCFTSRYELNHATKDHLSVHVQIVPPPVAPVTIRKRRTPSYNRQLTSSGDHVKHFCDLLSAPPCIPYDVEVTSHQYILDEWVSLCAAQAFPLGGAYKRKSYISNFTYQYIYGKRQHMKEYMYHHKLILLSPVRAAFGIWTNRLWRARWSPLRGFSSKPIVHKYITYFKLYHDLTTYVKAYVDMDKSAYLAAKADDVEY